MLPNKSRSECCTNNFTKVPSGRIQLNKMLFRCVPNPTYQAFVTQQPDWGPFNWLGADVVNKQKYKTGKVSDLPHIILL